MQAEAEHAERVLHDLVLAAQRDLGGRRQILLHFGDHLVDLGGDRPEIAPFDIGGDVDDALDGVVVDRIHRRAGTHARDVAQSRHRRARERRRQGLRDDRIDVVGGRIGREIQDVRDRLQLLDRRDHGDGVVHAVLRIEIVGRADQMSFRTATPACCWRRRVARRRAAPRAAGRRRSASVGKSRICVMRGSTRPGIRRTICSIRWPTS